MIGNPPNNNQVTNNLVTQAEKPLTAREKNEALHGEWGSARTGISLVALSGVLARCDHQISQWKSGRQSTKQLGRVVHNQQVVFADPKTEWRQLRDGPAKHGD